MPRASRRRRRPPGQGYGQLLLVGCAATVTIVLVAGTLLAVHTQSASYRTATTSSYVAMAQKVAEESARTGAHLATVLEGAPDLVNQAFPYSARGVLQAELDAAARDATDQAAQAMALAPPAAQGEVSTRFSGVIAVRASATQRIRSTVDALLGMAPLPVPGAPPSSGTSGGTGILISSNQAALQLASAGHQLVASDAAYGAVAATVRRDHLRFQLPRSVWVVGPASLAPLGPRSLAATAAALASSPALVPFHHLVITATGLVPAAIPEGAPGTSTTSCIAPMSVSPGSTPTVVPPTTSLAVAVTITNCGTVPERDVTVTVEVALDDPPGTAAPSARTGGRNQQMVALQPAGSAAPAFGALSVAPGHLYRVTVSVAVPAGQSDATGSTQSYEVRVAN